MSYQDIVKSLSKDLDIPYEEKGICFGFAVMGLYAGLTGDMSAYHARLAAMTDIYHKKIALQFAEDPHSLFKLSLEQRDIEIFLSQLNLFQSPDRFSEVLNVGAGAYLAQYELLHALFSELAPDSLHKPAIADLIVGNYSKRQVNDYLVCIAALAKPDKPLGLLLTNKNHAVSVVYDPKSHPDAPWCFIDANSEKVVNLNADQLADQIFVGFFNSAKFDTAFFTRIVHDGSLEITDPRHLGGEIAAKWQQVHLPDSDIDLGRENRITEALKVAIINRQAQMVKSLLEIVPGAANRKLGGETMLHLALSIGDNAVVSELLASKQCAYDYFSNVEWNGKNYMVGPLYEVAATGNVEVLDRMLANIDEAKQAYLLNLDILDDDLLEAADFDETAYEKAHTGMTPFFVAVRTQQVGIVKRLLQVPGFRVEPTLVNGQPFSALYDAIYVENIELVKVLLQHPGIDVNLAHLGYRPIDIALSSNNYDIALLIVSDSRFVASDEEKNAMVVAIAKALAEKGLQGPGTFPSLMPLLAMKGIVFSDQDLLQIPAEFITACYRYIAKSGTPELQAQLRDLGSDVGSICHQVLIKARMLQQAASAQMGQAAASQAISTVKPTPERDAPSSPVPG